MGYKKNINLKALVLLLSVLTVMAAGEVKQEKKGDQNQAKGSLELNIVDIHGAPTLSVNTKPKTFGIQFFKGQYRITTEEVPVLTFDDQKIDSGDLVYSTEDPILKDSIRSFGYDTWKVIKADLDFKDMDQSKITQCGKLKIYGGRCKYSKEQMTIKVDLPPHKKVRISAVYHYFGGWTGYMSYLKAKVEGNLYYLWNEKYDNR